MSDSKIPYSQLILARHVAETSDNSEELLGQNIIEWANKQAVAEESENASVVVFLEGYNTPPSFVLDVMRATDQGMKPSEANKLISSTRPGQGIKEATDRNFFDKLFESLDKAHEILIKKNYKLIIIYEHMLTPEERIEATDLLAYHYEFADDFVTACRNGETELAKESFIKMGRNFTLLNILRDESNVKIWKLLIEKNPQIRAIFSQFGSMHRYFAMRLGLDLGNIDIAEPNQLHPNGQDKLLGYIMGKYLTTRQENTAQISPEDAADFIKNIEIPDSEIFPALLEQWIYEALLIDKPLKSTEYENVLIWASEKALECVAKLLENAENLEERVNVILKTMSKEGVETYLKDRWLL